MRAHEFLNEIGLYAYNPDAPFENYNQYFSNSLKEPAFGNLSYAKGRGEFDVEYYALFNGDSIISIIELQSKDIPNFPYMQVTRTQTEPDFQRQGCMRYLLNKALDDHGTVASDNNQSELAKAAWESMIKYPNGMNIKFWKDGDLIPAKSASSDEIWDGDMDTALVASKFTRSNESIIAEQKFQAKLKMMGHTRQIDMLYYGPSSTGTNEGY